MTELSAPIDLCTCTPAIPGPCPQCEIVNQKARAYRKKGQAQAQELTAREYTYITDGQELAPILEYLAIPQDDAANITAAFVVQENGDYSEIWITESSRPWAANAEYFMIDDEYLHPEPMTYRAADLF